MGQTAEWVSQTNACIPLQESRAQRLLRIFVQLMHCNFLPALPQDAGTKQATQLSIWTTWSTWLSLVWTFFHIIHKDCFMGHWMCNSSWLLFFLITWRIPIKRRSFNSSCQRRHSPGNHHPDRPWNPPEIQLSAESAWIYELFAEIMKAIRIPFNYIWNEINQQEDH